MKENKREQSRRLMVVNDEIKSQEKGILKKLLVSSSNDSQVVIEPFLNSNSNFGITSGVPRKSPYAYR